MLSQRHKDTKKKREIRSHAYLRADGTRTSVYAYTQVSLLRLGAEVWTLSELMP
jgi:hypothetical protein